MAAGVSTRLIVLLGDPVGHSLSPAFQNAAIRAAGLDAVYLALRVGADRFRGLVEGLRDAGAAGNVTLPHKARMAALLDDAAPAVRSTGACNTFWVENGSLRGDNTDVEGFAASARSLIGSPAGARVLVLGAGGAARAAVLALMDARADRIHVLNRREGPARSLRDALDPSGRRVDVLAPDTDLAREGYDLVVNATPLGLRPDDPLPLDLAAPARVGAALDLTYRAGEDTAWVRAARSDGVRAADGREMLLHQGAAAFRRWFDRKPDLDAMRAALDG